MKRSVRKNTQKINKVFFLYFLSYCAVIIIPVIFLSVFSYQLSLRALEDELTQSNNNSLKQTSIALNDSLNEINALSVHLGLNGKLYGYTKSTDDNTYLLNEVKDLVNNLASTNEKIHSIDVFFNKNNLIISSSGLTRKYDGGERDQWIGTMRKSGQESEWMEGQFINYDGNLETMITLTRKFPVASSHELGYILIRVYEDQLSETIQKMEYSPYTNTYVIDRSGKVISSYIQQNDDYRLIGTRQLVTKVLSLGEEGYFIDKADEPFSLISYANLNNDWFLVSQTPLTYLIEKLSYIKKVTLLTSLFLIILGIFISYLLSRKMYNPIKKLIVKTKNYQKELSVSAQGNNGNDFTFLSGILDRVVVKNMNLEESFKANYPILIDRFVINLVNNKITSLAEIEDKIAALDLDISTTGYTVILIEIDDYSDLLDRYSAEDMNVYKFAINNIAGEIMDTYFKWLSTEVNENQSILLVNVDDYNEEVKQRLEKAAGQIRQSIHHILNFSVTISVGKLYRNITQAYLSYKEAQDVIKHKLVLGKNKTIFYDEMNRNQTIDYYYPLQIERSVMNNVTAGQFDDAKHYMNELRKEMTMQHNLSYENIHRLYSRLLDASINVLKEKNASIKELFGGNYFLYQELGKRETVDSIHEWMCFVLNKIADHISSQEKNNTIEEVLYYIQKHYKSDLSVDMIAEHVNLNPAYLSRTFKQHTGKTIVEYLTLERMEESKSLLSNSTLNIKEIAATVGYNNTNSFIRYFKRHEGITPGEYRKHHSME